MIKFEEYEYYIRPGFTDMRKGAVMLSIIVQEEMGMNPFSKSIFLFCGRNRKMLKTTDFNQNRPLILTKRNTTDFNQKCQSAVKKTITFLSLAM